MNKDKLKKFLLSEKHKRTTLDFIFSMSGFIAIIVLMEVILLIITYRNFLNYIVQIYGVVLIIDIFALLYMLDHEKVNFEIKTTWSIIILLIPLLGSFIYFYIHFDIFNRSYKKRFFKIEKESLNALTIEDDCLKEIEDITELNQLHHYMNKTGNSNVYKNCYIKYFGCGEDLYPTMLEELRNANEFIFLEYFIIDRGKMWDKILEILIEKVQKNVDVRIVYDGTCDFKRLPSDYWRKLQQLGIKCYKFSPLLPMISPYYNFRDHRKIMIIDGKVAFTGGINIADEYINELDLFGYWKDTAVMIKGKAVRSYTMMFLQIYSLVSNSDDFSLLNREIDDYPSQGYLIPYGDIPLDKYLTGKNVYLHILNSAKNYVYIMTPYFIIDSEVLNAIYNAGLRGVDVRLILPHIPDKVTVNEIAKGHYKDLLANNIRIYEFEKGFVHAKQMISDDNKAVVGTINLDYRSLYHHYEDGLFMYDCPVIDDIKNDFLQTIQQSIEVTDKYKLNKFKQFIAKLVKPFEPLL